MTFKQILAFTGILALAELAASQGQTQTQVQPFGQCGGIRWSGATACVDGWVCTASNELYSQCLPETNGPFKKRAPQYETPGTPTYTYQTPTYTYQTPTYTYPTPTYTYPYQPNYNPEGYAPRPGILGLPPLPLGL